MYNTYPQNNSYAPQYNGYNGYAPQQPMPVAAPVAQSSTNTGRWPSPAWPSSVPPPSEACI